MTFAIDRKFSQDNLEQNLLGFKLGAKYMASNAFTVSDEDGSLSFKNLGRFVDAPPMGAREFLTKLGFVAPMSRHLNWYQDGGTERADKRLLEGWYQLGFVDKTNDGRYFFTKKRERVLEATITAEFLESLFCGANEVSAEQALDFMAGIKQRLLDQLPIPGEPIEGGLWRIERVYHHSEVVDLGFYPDAFVPRVLIKYTREGQDVYQFSRLPAEAPAPLTPEGLMKALGFKIDPNEAREMAMEWEAMGFLKKSDGGMYTLAPID